MRFLGSACLMIATAFAVGAAACDGGGATGTTGAAGSTASSSSGGGSEVTTSASSSVSATTTSSGTTSGTGGTGGASCASMYKPTGLSCSGTKPSLMSDVAPITAASCSSADCHSAMDSASGVRLQLVGVIAEECEDLRLMVNPSNPECSYVIHKLTGTNESGCSPQTTMPLGMAKLPASHVQTIYDWICQGAPNN